MTRESHGAEAEGATPLEPEELEELIPSHITMRRELNEAELANIIKADQWAFSVKRNALEIAFLNRLHNRMLCDVWKWAGKFRQTEKNIGVAPHQIQPQMKTLIDDCRFWIDHNVYHPDEIATRFHHRLVSIHPYVNGNGRHARLATDLLLRQIKRPRFTWGRTSLVDADTTRQQYIDALRAADNGDLTQLGNFVRS